MLSYFFLRSRVQQTREGCCSVVVFPCLVIIGGSPRMLLDWYIGVSGFSVVFWCFFCRVPLGVHLWSILCGLATSSPWLLGFWFSLPDCPWGIPEGVSLRFCALRPRAARSWAFFCRGLIGGTPWSILGGPVTSSPALLESWFSRPCASRGIPEFLFFAALS